MPKNYTAEEWSTIRTRLRDWWGDLSDDDMRNLDANPHGVTDFLHRKYGVSEEDVNLHFDAWLQGLEGQVESPESEPPPHK